MTPTRMLLLAPLALACNVPRLVDKSTMTSMAPQIMANPDVGLGCATGAAMAPVLGALGDEDDRPDKALVLTMMSAAMCAEPVAWEAEILRLQAVRAGDGARSQDLLEVERRAHSLAARRYLAAWNHLEAAFGPLGEACPQLDSRKNDDLLLLLGLSSGLLASLHDQAGGAQVGVPLDVTRKVERAAGCLDNTTWWGVPAAMQAAVWASVPGATPDGADPIATLSASAAAGGAAGVHLARAFQAQTLATIGEVDGLKAAVAEQAEARRSPGMNPDYKLLNNYANQLIRHESDKRWVRATGHRTPGPHYGTFPSDPSAAEPKGLDELLDSFMTPAQDDGAATDPAAGPPADDAPPPEDRP